MIVYIGLSLMAFFVFGPVFLLPTHDDLKRK